MSRGTKAYAILVASSLGCGGDGPTEPGPSVEQPEPSVPAAATEWLGAEIEPFARTSPTGDFADLEAFRQAVGDARIVALGEATHGTRDFFEMKDRLLRFLVAEMGFNAFAIEATWPEANRLDDYVRTGAGDAAELLSGLYFWTWNTESVLNMIEWMRDHDAGGGDLGFYGFDMQYPGMAVANIEWLVEEVDPGALDELRQQLTCIGPFLNDAQGTFNRDYAAQPQTYRDPCRESLEGVEQWLADREEVYVAGASREAFDRAVQSARVVLQWEAVESGLGRRDEAMARNVQWLLDQLGPDARIVLWAHNYPVSSIPEAMGSYLRQAYGDQMVVLGFAFGGGSFTAVTMNSGAFLGLDRHSLERPLAGSYEEYFASAGQPRFYLDLRDRALDTEASSWLAGPRTFRSIGCCFDPSQPSAFAYQARLPDEFDGIIYVDRTTPTTVLPFKPPTAFR